MYDLRPPANLAELVMNPQRVKDAFTLLSLLQNSSYVKLVTKASTTNNAVSFTGNQITIPIPLLLDYPIADSTASAASVSTQLNLLLAALRKSGQLPS